MDIERDGPVILVADFHHPAGWLPTVESQARMCWYGEQLEAGRILVFDRIPFDLPEEHQQVLRAQHQADSRYHKNVSYRPGQDRLRGLDARRHDEVERLRGIMRAFSGQVIGFLSRFLAPYAPQWSVDLASFRPLEESRRRLPLHKRNDLIHVDAFPTRPTGGGRILRVFANIHPSLPRVWVTTDPFEALATRFATEAGLPQIAARASSPLATLLRRVAPLGRATGIPALARSPYDRVMLRFHDFLKAHAAFQEGCAKRRLEFPPQSVWVVFTDGFPHAVVSGQFALEQTVIVPPRALLTPDTSPLRVLERLCGRPLAA
jgi:hypothetical protein